MSYWKYVPGLENIECIYTSMLESVNDSSVIVETGCDLGRGIHYMMESFKEKKVKPKLYAFDTFGENHFRSEFWEGYPKLTSWNEPFDKWTERIGGPSRVIDQFVFHLKNSPASEYLTDWAQFPHWTVAEEFKDKSIDYVFAFGSKNEKTAKEELRKWWPKLKSNGIIMINTFEVSGVRHKIIIKND